MFTDTCQKVFDFFTIFADLLIREPINDKDWLNIACLTSILFVIMILGCIGSALLDVPDDNKNYVLYSVLHQSKIIAGLASLITAIIGGLLSMIILAQIGIFSNITPSFTHTHYSNIVIDSPKRKIYTNNSKVGFTFSYDENDEHVYLDTDGVYNHGIESIFDNQSSIIGDLIGAKGDSNNSVHARLKKENVRIIKTDDAKKYPDYVSYKISKIEVEDGTATKTAYHQSEKVKIKELYLELTAYVDADGLKDAKQDEQDHKNQNDVDQLLNN